MSKEDLIAAIESRLDTIEGLLDELEDNQVKVEPFRDSLGKLWNEWEKLSEQKLKKIITLQKGLLFEE